MYNVCVHMYEFSSVFKFMCVCVCVVQVHKYVSAYVWGSEANIGYFLALVFTLFVMQSLLFEVRACFCFYSGSQLVPKIPSLCLLSTGITNVFLSTLGIYVGTGM